MGDGDNAQARLAARGIEQAADVQRLALKPGGEAGRRQEVIEAKRQVEAILFRVKGVQLHDADRIKRRSLDQPDQLGQVEAAPGAPAAEQDIGHQDMLTAADRVGRLPDQTEQAAGQAADLFLQQLGIVEDFAGRYAKGLQNGNRDAGRTAGRIDGKFRRGAHVADAIAVLAPSGDAQAPFFRLLRGELIRCQASLAGVVLVDPGPEVRWRQVGERQHQVGHVALGVDHDGRYAVQGGFLQKADAKAGLAAAGHADTNGMRRQVLRLVKQKAVFLNLLLTRLTGTPHIENAEFFKIHRRSPPILSLLVF